MALQHIYAHAKKYWPKQLLCICFIGVMATGILNNDTAFAQETEAQSRQFTAKAGEIVLEAQNFLTANQNAVALKKLSEALTIPSLTAYERSTIYQMQGAAYYALGKYGLAITAFENAINADGLLPNEVDNLRVNIAQLMIANGQYVQGAQALENYLDNGGTQNPKYVEMLTQAWVQSKNYNRALPWAEKWYHAARPKERKHFDLLNFLYSNLKMSDHQIDLVKEMIKRWPEERAFWDSWASLLAMNGREKDAFEVNKFLYLRGVLTREADLMKLIQYYSFYDMPYQAAGILEKEMNAGRISSTPDKLEQLASLFRQAREYKRAIPILEAAAAGAGKGSVYAQLGEALYNEGECTQAEGAFKNAIDKGYNAGKAWMLIGTCRYEEIQKLAKLNCQMSADAKMTAPISKARKSTIQAFEKVPPQSDQSGDASKWISFIKTERLTFDKRCEFEKGVRTAQCFKDIADAKENEFIDGKLVLGDPTCSAYLDEYEKEYGRSSAG